MLGSACVPGREAVATNVRSAPAQVMFSPGVPPPPPPPPAVQLHVAVPVQNVQVQVQVPVAVHDPLRQFTVQVGTVGSCA